MHKRPVIGVPAIVPLGNHYMLGSYLIALLRAGARPCILRRSTSQKHLARCLARCDGFLLPGGQDIDPAYYGQKRSPACGKPARKRDLFELMLTQQILQAERPVLGICRGCQVLAVANHGSVIQDIKPIQSVRHNDQNFLHMLFGTHEIALAGNSILRRLVPQPETTLRVNSVHHQVVEHPGAHMRVIARGPEGFIEAFQRDGHPFCLGIQWHPEFMILTNRVHQNIFNALVAACRTSAYRRTEDCSGQP